MGERKNLVYPIPGPDEKDILPKRQWLWGMERAYQAHKNGELEFIKGKDGLYSVHTKQYLNDENGTIRQAKPFSIIDDIYTQHGTNEFIELFGNAHIFSFPKPSEFIRKLIDIGTDGKGDEIILDFFAGSCSTVHAVFSANNIDNKSRKFIAVQLPEICINESEAYKSGYKTIAEISKERIRRAGKKIKEKNANKEGIDQLDIGFRVLKIDTSNMKDVYYTPDAMGQGSLFDHIDNIREDRTPEDLLFQVLLDWGVDLTLQVTQKNILGKTVFFVDEDALVACFDEHINEALVKELATYKPVRVVFHDASFDSDSVKINVEQIFKLASPSTEVRTI